MKKIVFRADGNRHSGLGHLYRCIAMAEMLESRQQCLFLTREDSVLEAIPARFPIRTLAPGISFEDEPDWIAENYPPAEYQIVADGYHFNAAYQKAVKQKGYRLTYIDDMATEHMYADMVINHAPSATTTEYRAESYTKFALGTGYALLRPAFIALAGSRKAVTREPKTAFVCFGGSDPYNLTGRVVKILEGFSQVTTVNVISGAGKDLQALSGNLKQALHTYRNLDEKALIDVMISSDFAIVPTSTVLFEVCCVRMQVLTGYYVENQRKAYQAFVDQHLAAGVGNFLEAGDELIRQSIERLLSERDITMLQQQQLFFDGTQKTRIINLFAE